MYCGQLKKRNRFRRRNRVKRTDNLQGEMYAQKPPNLESISKVEQQHAAFIKLSTDGKEQIEDIGDLDKT